MKVLFVYIIIISILFISCECKDEVAIYDSVFFAMVTDVKRAKIIYIKSSLGTEKHNININSFNNDDMVDINYNAETDSIESAPVQSGDYEINRGYGADRGKVDEIYTYIYIYTESINGDVKYYRDILKIDIIIREVDVFVHWDDGGKWRYVVAGTNVILYNRYEYKEEYKERELEEL